jgi:hypothetical protein
MLAVLVVFVDHNPNPMLARIVAPDHARLGMQAIRVLNPALATPRLPKIDMGVAAVKVALGESRAKCVPHIAESQAKGGVQRYSGCHW